MQSKSGTFTGSGSTGNQAITGVGFQPEFLILISNGLADTLVASDARFILGMASGPSDQQAIDFRDDDNQGTSNTARSQQSGKIISVVSLTTDVVGNSASLVSFDADGFTINWENISVAVFQFIAIAGADFQAHVDSFDMNGSTGNQTVTGVPFQPKAVLFFGTIDNTTEGAQAQAKLTIGCATAADERWALAVYDQDNAGVSIAKEYLTEAACIARINASAVTLAADFVAFTSDGFTIDITTALACRMAFVALGGSADFHAGTVQQPTSNGAVQESGIGLAPDAVIFAGVGAASQAVVAGDCYATFGWSDENLDDACIAISVDDAETITDSHRDQAVAACIERLSPTANTVITQAGMDSLDSDGFTLDWVATDATQSIIGYLAMGTAFNPGPGTNRRGGWMWVG